MIDEAVLAAAGAAGLAGTLHCALMCGPLAATGRALPYQAGRFLSYAFVGAGLGLIGEHALCRFPVGSVQTVALGLVAVFAVVKAIAVLCPARPSLVPLARPGRWRRATRSVAAALPRGAFPLGLATGFLPCAMLLPGWMLAAGAGHPLGGSAAMAVFWAGTLPGLLAPNLLRRVLHRPLGARWQSAAWAALAVWLALRPLLMAGHHH